MRRGSLWTITKLLGENIKLRKEKDKLEIDLGKLHKKYDKEMMELEKRLEKKYSSMSRRNEILSEDNRRLACIVRKYEKKG